jgi:catechol 2,3-dioxygenase-like lactoylglutathione lyase family enzyme
VTESGSPTAVVARGADHVGLSVENLAAQVDFYRRALGFEEEVAFELPLEGIQAVMLVHPSGFRLELFGHPDSLPGLQASGPIEAHATRGFNHFAMTADEIESLYSNAVAAGARPVIDPQPSPLGMKFAFFADPEGHLVELLARNRR